MVVIKRLWANFLPLWGLTLALLVILAVFSYLQASPIFSDPDSYYHTRLTTLQRDTGIVHEFPWTQSSLYKNIFIDHHFGYHLLLIPFVSIFSNELVGIKIATILFATLSVFAAVWCLKKWRVPWWGVGVVLLLTTGPLLFRLSLAKAPSLGVGVAIVGYYLVTQRKNAWLFWWAWFYTWLYSAWPLLLVMAIVFVIIESLSLWSIKTHWRENLKKVFRELFSRQNYKIIGAILAGYICGVVINPYFPTNLLYLKQLFSMALVSYNKFIGIGAEWYPYGLSDLPADLAHSLLVWFLSTLVGFATFKRQSNLSRTTWILSIIFLAYTLRARRQVEYLAPWIVLSAGLLLRDAWVERTTSGLKELWQKFHSWLPWWLKGKFVLGFVAIYLLLVIPWGLWLGINRTKDSLRGGFSFNTYLSVSTWLKQNTPPHSIIFQSDWGSFPLLFYNNTHNYYLTGLDQTFMYEYDHDRFWQWVDTTTSKRNDIYEVAHNTFGASYILLESQYSGMRATINRDTRFRKVYEDKEATVYEIK